MLTMTTDFPACCVKCDSETKYLIQAFNHELRLEPICWRCFERTDKRINVRPGWIRMRRNDLNLSQPVYADGKPQNRRVGLRLARSGAVENQSPERAVAAVRPAAASREMAKAA